MVKKKDIKRQRQEESNRTKIGVSIDTQLWRRLRALAIRRGKLTGELLDAAIKDFVDKSER